MVRRELDIFTKRELNLEELSLSPESELTFEAHSLLLMLADQEGRTVSSAKLIRNIWGKSTPVYERELALVVFDLNTAFREATDSPFPRIEPTRDWMGYRLALKPSQEPREYLLRDQVDLEVGLEPIQIGRLEINQRAPFVSVDGRTIKLTPTEYQLLLFLARNPDTCLEHRQILEHVWGLQQIDDMGSLRLYIQYLRQKIETDPKNPEIILTVRGEGYIFTGGAPSQKEKIQLENGYILDQVTRELITPEKQIISLTPMEFKLLNFLMRYPQTPLPHEAILHAIWGAQFAHERYIYLLRDCIMRLRRKVEIDPKNPEIIVNHHGWGYGFEGPVGFVLGQQVK